MEIRNNLLYVNGKQVQMTLIDKIGEKYGRLLVLKKECVRFSGSKRQSFYLCKCDCGREVIVASGNLSHREDRKSTRSCGCGQKDAARKAKTTHGGSKTVEFNTWSNIKSKCLNPKDKKYYIYGGRGIKVCERWINSYENFLIDMGNRPFDCTSIDRINVNGDYDPSNCRWSNHKEQANNKRTNVFISYKGIKLTLKQWSEELKYSSYRTFHRKIREKGFTLEQLIEEKNWQPNNMLCLHRNK